MDMKAFLARLYRKVPLPLVRLAVRFFNTRFNIAVAGVFFSPDGKVLVLRHVYRRLYPWGLPAGFVNAGEAPEAAAIREVWEEIGLKAQVTRILEVRPVRPRHMQVVVVGTVAPDQPMQPNGEIFEGMFAAPDALPPDMMPSQAETVRRALAQRTTAPVFSSEI